ncbi:TetR/AcrR family transcriptional regulator [Gordonia amicalis]|uniref:TetR/AcrR family transcriptional regulator n=1 Tax=Gordonia amicalis TaxID=89053 RepID=UPI001FB6261D|nr:TetR/AcrR family transcriptional regulator [Gordonia amicalis]MDV7102134.1 TetR/AcrR family transcriptional regulator [Gordonia amicalis]MDV7172720.1 TetR/AcrR family transcriptional regulator [Gordonia amicalis]UOG20510.1 TetR/AcrR family transcriptional regulator [Gordonia amicalis]
MAASENTAVDPRERVIRAADELFNAHGVHAVGMDKVRDAAGVSLKKIYSLFPSKEALILAVLDDRSGQWNAGIADCTEGLSTPREKLLAIFDFLLGWFGTDEFRGCAFINAYGELGGELPSVAEAVRKQKDGFQDYVAGLVAELGGPPRLAAQLSILAEGAQTTAAIAGTAQAADDARSAAEILIDQALE